VYVDCISVYHLNEEGLVRGHNFETIVVNGTPVEPPFAYAWINLDPWLVGERVPGVAIPTAHSQMQPPNSMAFTPAAIDESVQQQQQQTPPVSVSGAGAVALAAAVPANSKKNSGGKKKPAFAVPKVDLPKGCENSWDCDSPQVCCDFAFFKMCCNQGMGVPVVPEPRLIPIPIPVEERYPPDYGRYPDYY
jgi:hypothetical protein